MKEHILQIGKDSFWYVLAQGVFAVIAFLSVPIFTRIFTPAEYGIYSLVVTTLGFATPFFYIWLTNSLLRYYPEYKKKDDLEIFYSTVFHYAPHFLLAVLVVLLPIALFVLPLGKYRAVISLGIAVLALSVIFYVGLAVLQARQKARWYALFFVLVAAGRYLVGALLATRAHAGVAGIFWAWLGMLVIVTPLELLVLRVPRYTRWRAYKPALMKEFIRFGFVLIFVCVSLNILTAIDRYMVQAFKGSTQVGLYSVVYTLVVDVFAITLYAVQQGAVPVVFKTYEYEGREVTISLITKLTRYFLIIMVPSTVAICILRVRIISVIATPKYLGAATVVVPLTIGLLLCNMGWLPSLSFYLEKKTAMTLWPVGLSALFNIALNLVLIPLYGFTGAAWATFFSYVLYLALMVLFARKYLPWRFPWEASLRVFAASALTGAVVYGLGKLPLSNNNVLGLVVPIVGGTLAFALAFAICRGWTGTELAFVGDLVQRIPLLRRITGGPSSGPE